MRSISNVDVWRGEFGDDYTVRNGMTEIALRQRTAMWESLLRHIEPPMSILEVGAGVGLNLRVLANLTDAGLIAVEPNASARQKLVGPWTDLILNGTATDIPSAGADLVFTCGVLIHIPPDDLGIACDEIYRVSSRYIICIEYFAAEPEEKSYRGRNGLMWKRDFGDFWMKRHKLELIDCKFFWKRSTGLDNLTAWVFEK